MRIRPAIFSFRSVIMVTNKDGIVKSPSLDFLLTETEKCDFRFPYKSTGYKTIHFFACPSMGTMMTSNEVINKDPEGAHTSVQAMESVSSVHLTSENSPVTIDHRAV